MKKKEMSRNTTQKKYSPSFSSDFRTVYTVDQLVCMKWIQNNVESQNPQCITKGDTNTQIRMAVAAEYQHYFCNSLSAFAAGGTACNHRDLRIQWEYCELVQKTRRPGGHITLDSFIQHVFCSVKGGESKVLEQRWATFVHNRSTFF